MVLFDSFVNVYVWGRLSLKRGQITVSAFSFFMLTPSFLGNRYYLQPREGSNHKSQRPAECSSLRVRVSYEVDSVFPSEHYAPLLDVLLGSPQVEVRKEDCNIIFSSMQNSIASNKGEKLGLTPLLCMCRSTTLSDIKNPIVWHSDQRLFAFKTSKIWNVKKMIILNSWPAWTDFILGVCVGPMECKHCPSHLQILKIVTIDPAHRGWSLSQEFDPISWVGSHSRLDWYCPLCR